MLDEYGRNWFQRNHWRMQIAAVSLVGVLEVCFFAVLLTMWLS